jgi:PAS domain S-box-containing protein
MSDKPEAGLSAAHQINAPDQPTPVYTAPQWRESDEARFQALLEAAPDAIVIVDKDGQILIVNSQTERLFGYSKQELLGQPIELLLPESLRKLHARHRSHYVAEPRTRPMGSGLDLVALRKDGSVFPVEISLSAIRTKEGMLFTSIVRDVTERRQATDELAQQAATLRAQANLLELAHDTILVRDLNSVITFWNHGAEQMYGWSKQEALGRISHDLLQTQFSTPLADIDAALLSEGRWEGELVHTRRDGTFVIVSSRQVVQHDEQGRPTAILEIDTDITERKRAADELARQGRLHAERLDTLIQFSQELLGTPSLDTVLQRAMSRALSLAPAAQAGAIYLYDPQRDRLALRASVGFKQLPDFSRPTDLGVIGRAFTMRQAYQIRSPAEWAALAPDLLGDREQLMRALGLAEPPTGMLAIPLIARDQAVGVLVLLRLTGTGDFAVEARSTLEGLSNLAATAILEEGNARAVATLSSKVAHLEAEHRNLNERVSSAEAGMLQAARLAAVGQLAASIAHEINNPLYAARNSLYLLEDDLPPDLRDSSYLAIARDQMARIARIIERMRDFYRPDRGEMSPYDINRLLEETLALAGIAMRHSAIQVIFAPMPDLPEVICNADQLRQVFLNLIMNAGDAMPNGGTLTVRSTAGPTVAIVEVQDTGIGIPPSIRDRLFEPFFTNKSNGTGLGLSISAHIVTQHGGQIEVESTEGVGSTSRVVLPYQDQR